MSADIDVPHPDTALVPSDSQDGKISGEWWRALKLMAQSINSNKTQAASDLATLQAAVTALTARVHALENP
jgi:hypothetical protein